MVAVVVLVITIVVVVVIYVNGSCLLGLVHYLNSRVGEICKFVISRYPINLFHVRR